MDGLELTEIIMRKDICNLIFWLIEPLLDLLDKRKIEQAALAQIWHRKAGTEDCFSKHPVNMPTTAAICDIKPGVTAL